MVAFVIYKEFMIKAFGLGYFAFSCLSYFFQLKTIAFHDQVSQ